MKLKMILLAVAGLAASGADAASATHPACSKDSVIAAGSEVEASRAALTKIALEEDETRVPPAASSRIERVKDRIRDLVRAQMACTSASPAPAKLAATLAAAGKGLAVSRPREPLVAPLPDHHGASLSYRAALVESQPDMLAVVATLAIRCGSDSMLMLYRREGALWRETMVRRAPPYSQVKGGWGDFRFEVSPKDRQGRWFVATVSVTPWCTSAWQGMPYELARPGPAPDRPNVFFRGKNTVYLGNETDTIVRAEADGFEIRHDGSSIDSEILIRRHVRRYSVAGDSVRRVQPVAETVRDFVDEWVTSPWSEAREWSGSDPGLAAAHKALQAARHKTLRGFASIRACTGGTTQVEIGEHEGSGWFLRVRGAANGPWTVEKVERPVAPGCTGPDLPGR